MRNQLNSMQKWLENIVQLVHSNEGLSRIIRKKYDVLFLPVWVVVHVLDWEVCERGMTSLAMSSG